MIGKSINQEEEKFAERLTKLRMQKGVSQRDMSLSIGQNQNYINCIENGKTFPSMSGFFLICEYLDVKPVEFFDYQNKNPKKHLELYARLCNCKSSQLSCIERILDEFERE